MSRYTKARDRLLSFPKDYTYEDQCCILLHKPHPQDVMDIGTLRDLVNRLKELGEL